MKKERTLSAAIRRIACAYICINVNLHLNGINILPDCIGCLIIFYQLDTITKAEESAALLKPLAVGLAAWDLLTFLAGENLSVLADYGSLIAGAVGLYFHFQLMTNLADIAHRENTGLGEKLRRLRTAQTLFITVLRLPWPSFPTENFGVVLLILLAQLGILVWEVITLYDLSRALENRETI